MRRYWWFVWVKVAVLAVALFFAYQYVRDYVDELLSPYLIEAPEEAAPSEDLEDSEDEGNKVDQLMGWVEEKLDVQINYEDLIFDYANDYAQKMIEQSDDERSVETSKKP